MRGRRRLPLLELLVPRSCEVLPAAALDLCHGDRDFEHLSTCRGHLGCAITPAEAVPGARWQAW